MAHTEGSDGSTSPVGRANPLISFVGRDSTDCRPSAQLMALEGSKLRFSKPLLALSGNQSTHFIRDFEMTPNRNPTVTPN